MVSQQRLAWPSRRRLVLSRRARLLDAPRTSAGRPASGSYGEKGPLSAARRPSPLGEGAERSEADEVCRGGSVTRPSRISHIPFSNVRLGGRPKGLPCLIPEELLENRRGGAEGESAEGREKPPWGVPLRKQHGRNQIRRRGDPCGRLYSRCESWRAHAMRPYWFPVDCRGGYQPPECLPLEEGSKEKKRNPLQKPTAHQ